MARRALLSRRRRLQTDKNGINKNKAGTTSAPTTPPTIAATASPTPLPIPMSTAAPTVSVTSPPVLPTTLSPTVTGTAPPVLPTTLAPTVTVTGTQPPVLPTTLAPTAAITGTQPPVLPSTTSPTMSATATAAPVPVATTSPTAAVNTSQTSSPTFSPSPANQTEVAVPTLAPTFIIDSVVESLHLEFSTWTDSTLNLEEQESSLLEILNVAMCSTGVQLVTRNMTDACPPGVWQDLGEPTVIWNQPVAFATLLDTSYWRWNFTYSVLETGYQTQYTLQGMLNDSITSGRMDTTLELQWDAPSKAKVVGTEKPIISGVPQGSAEILRNIGILLAVLTVLMVWLLTHLARQHRHRKDAKTVQIVFSSSSRENGADVNLEEMLSQSREIVLQQKPTVPPALLPAVASEDDEDDIALRATADPVVNDS